MIPALVTRAVLAAAVTIRRIRRAEARDATHYQRVRTADQVMDDARRWKANRRTREAREDHATCNAIWNLPTVPQQRKELP